LEIQHFAQTNTMVISKAKEAYIFGSFYRETLPKTAHKPQPANYHGN